VFSLSSVLGGESDVLRERPFQLLILANALPPLGTALLSPVLESLIDPFGASTANIGLMMSMYTAPAIVMIPIVGVISDRYGRRPVLLFGLLCFGGAGTAIAFVPNFRAALFFRFLQGIGFAALTPIIITSIGDLYTGTKETTAQGLRFSGSGLTQTVSPIVAGVLVGIAWQYPFFLCAIAFPIAAIIYFRFEEPDDYDPDTATESEGSVGDQLGRLWTLVSQRRALAMVVARGSTSVIWIGFLTYNSILVVELLQSTPAQAGVLASFASIGYAFSATQAGRIMSYFERNLFPLTVTSTAMGGGVSLAFLADTLAVAYVGVTMMGIGFGIMVTLYRSIITDLAPASLRGGLVSLAEGSGRMSATITPILMGATIAILTPRLGFVMSVRTVGVITGVFGGGIGVLCSIVLHFSPPIQIEE
jgi:MFS family permease